MQVQTILHAASTLLGLWDCAVRQGPGDRKLLITSKMTSKGKKTPQDEPALTERNVFTAGHIMHSTGWKWCRSSDECWTCIQSTNSEWRWVDVQEQTNNQRTSYADSITRQTSSISLSHCCQGMRGLCKVTLTKCLGVSREKRHWHYINFMSLF